MRSGIEDAEKQRGCQPEDPQLEPGQFAAAWELLADEAHWTAIKHGWWRAERNDGELIALMYSDLGKAFAELWKGEDRDDARLAGYLADCIIRIMDYAVVRGLCVGDAIERKVSGEERWPGLI